MQFNQEQLNIINNLGGALLVSAPVGTGKTTVLTERVAVAINQNIRPDEILCLTFTNRAAEEMKQRLKVRLDDPLKYSALTVGTFHGFCAKFLRQEAKELGLPHDFVIADDTEQIEVLERILGDYPGLVEPGFRLASLTERFYQHRLNSLYHQYDYMVTPPAPLLAPWNAIATRYYSELIDQNSLDFNDLVILTIKALYENKKLLDKWSSRFKLVQLDEFQDTHLSEYLVVKQLARTHKNILLVGDFDQTIYSWRGSQPRQVAALYKNHFTPVAEYRLTQNYRSNPSLLPLFSKISADLNNQPTVDFIAADNVDLVEAYNQSEEVNKLTDKLKAIKKTDPGATIAVLTRANKEITAIATALDSQGISYLTVDQYNFFRRQEIRDAYAWLKLLHNKYDFESARRVLLRPAKKINPEAILQINEDGKTIGLRVADFLSFANYRQAEPYSDLINTYKQGRLVVIDTETTGTDTAKDDVIQCFALEVKNGQVGERREWLIKTDKPVGNSYYVHRLTDDYLAEHGLDKKTALKEIIDFVGDSLVIGHNVSFDIAILEENANRVKEKFSVSNFYDTLDLAKRFIVAPNYKLETLSRLLGLHQAVHNAEDDVLASFELLVRLMPELVAGSDSRAKLFAANSKKFISLASAIGRWQLLAKVKRPVELLSIILEESGLWDYYSADKTAERRLKSLDTLKRLFTDLDDPALTPKEALARLLSYGSLVKNIDFLGLDEGKIPIITIHQVKGLEFDYVFMPMLNEGIFPTIRKNNDFLEEKRVFYVGLTRAKKGLYLSWNQFDDYNRPRAKSRFLAYFDNLG